MPKHGFLSPKAISNRIKSKGLQKLRWYCQMCQKQCRDENGFKCHCTSESHLRQMAIFAQKPGKVVDEFSEEFESTFMRLLSRRFGTRRVAANVVYNEYIADKQHLHMNSTKWVTLTSFVQYLGRTGKCQIDQTEKGWYIRWIDRDPATVARQKAALAMKKTELDETMRIDRRMKRLAEQAQAAAAAKGETAPKFTELKRDKAAPKVKVAIGGSSKLKKAGLAGGGRGGVAVPAANVFSATAGVGGVGAGGGAGAAAGGVGGKRGVKRKQPTGGVSGLDAIKREMALHKAREEATAQREAEEAAVKKARKDYWLAPGIVVKVMNKKVGDGKYYKKKAVVRKLVDKYVAIVKLLDGGSKLKLDQTQLETVLPRVGGKVQIVNGVHRGERGEVAKIDVDNFCCSVRLTTGPERGNVVTRLEYEFVCKLDKEYLAKHSESKSKSRR